MTRPGTIARRYARALFASADAQQSIEPVGAAFATIAEALGEPSAMRVLTGPVARERKRELLLKVASATRAPDMVRDFLLLLADHARLQQIPSIRSAFESLVDKKRGITRAAVRSATDLAPEMLAEITRTFGAITKKQVIAQVEVDPDLIAGVIVEVEGRVYDGSLRAQLGKLHQQMATGS
jgi:F-type H+-transporting ATPase subunit delta